MKKRASILLLFLYLFGVIGVGINSHYCCGEIASVNITYGTPNSYYTSRTPINKKGCCNDVTRFLKIHAAQKASFAEFILTAPALQIHQIPQVLVLKIGWEPLTARLTFISQSPPGGSSIPLFIPRRSLPDLITTFSF